MPRYGCQHIGGMTFCPLPPTGPNYIAFARATSSCAVCASQDADLRGYCGAHETMAGPSLDCPAPRLYVGKPVPCLATDPLPGGS